MIKTLQTKTPDAQLGSRASTSPRLKPVLRSHVRKSHSSPSSGDACYLSRQRDMAEIDSASDRVLHAVLHFALIQGVN